MKYYLTLLILGTALVLSLQLVYALQPEPVPEPKPDPEHAFDYTSCGDGTAYQEGICVADETTKNPNTPSDRWGGYERAYDEHPNLHTSPLRQILLGIPPQDILCNKGLELILRSSDGSPACVKPETKQKLIERGWTKDNENATINWKKYITISAARIDASSVTGIHDVYKLDDTKHDLILYQALIGADGCKNETEFCTIPKGVTLQKSYPFGISVTDRDDYSITLNVNEANSFLSKLDWTIDEDLIYAIVQWNAKYYLLMLSTFDQMRTPDVKMDIIGSSHEPIPISQGSILNYTIQVNTWATYGASAQIDFRATQSAKDSGIDVWVEPAMLTIPERSNATTTLFIQPRNDAKDGIYNIRVNGYANGKNADLHCGNTVCPAVMIGDSDWSIRTFGTSSGMGIGIGNSPENTWAEIILNKNEFFEGDMTKISAFVVNNGTRPIMVDEPGDLLIKVIRADSKGYYDQFYGIHAVYESDEPIILEPNSKTLLARPFYWNQTTFHDFEDEQRIEPSRRMITMDFTARNYTWNSDVWIEIK